jgi:glyceraldehyde 3-phosphate dehydrogenase
MHVASFPQMKKTKIAINGYGRIGRNLFRLINHPTIEVVAINDIADAHTMAHLTKYDSIHGTLPYTVSHTEDSIIIDLALLPLFVRQKDVTDINWAAYDVVDVVVESTGKFKTLEDAQKHLSSGAKKSSFLPHPKTTVLKP